MSHQPKQTSTRDKQRHGLLSIVYRSYGSCAVYFKRAVMSILLYGCTTWTLTKRMEKKLDGNYKRLLGAILKNSWRQHPTKQRQYGHLPPIMKTIKVRRTRHAGHCWRCRNDLIIDEVLWTPSHERANAARPVRTYIQLLCADKGCSPEELLESMDNREGWRGWPRISVLKAHHDDGDDILKGTDYDTTNVKKHPEKNANTISNDEIGQISIEYLFNRYGVYVCTNACARKYCS